MYRDKDTQSRRLPLILVRNSVVIVLVALWLLPTIGLLVSSFRDRDQISSSGWWRAPFSTIQYERHRFAIPADIGTQSQSVFTGNVFVEHDDHARDEPSKNLVSFGVNGQQPGAYSPGEVATLRSGGKLTILANGDFELAGLKEKNVNGVVNFYYGVEVPPVFTLNNYKTVLAANGMGSAFINTATVTIPATIIPILVAAFAAYALAWMRFRGRTLITAIIIGLMVVPVQLSLVPALTFHNWVGIGQSFVGVWLAHTGFGLPLAIYLLRNYMIGLPKEMIEVAKVDGASDFEIFVKLVLPLSFPAIASFATFQFLWTWNDLLVAKVFLPATDNTKVMTIKIADYLLGSRGGDWGILASAAFVSIALPIGVFLALQRYLVRGLIAGSVK